MHSSHERDQSVERLLRQSRQSRRVPQDAGLTDSCLDAETLAAWADGGLSGAALEMAETHVADCLRCQDLVGTLARINTAAVAAEPERTARRWLAWLVPLTAAAVVVAVWVAVPRNDLGRDVRLPPTTEVQEPRDDAKTEAQYREAPVNSAPAPASGSAPAQLSGTIVPEKTAKEEVAGSAELDARMRKDVAAPTSAAQAAEAAPAPTAPPPPTALGAERANRLSAADKLSEATAGIEVVSPNPMVRWRIAGSVVQHSTDGGATWASQSTGTTAELTAGAAPSASVCWLVGRGGVVLVSTDGRSWRRLAFPEITDLSGVRARDALAVSVSTADGRTFSTTDAGATWVPRPLQDF